MRVSITKLEGVDSVDVSLNQGRATVRLKPGSLVTLKQIRETVEQNGFTPKEATVTARARVRLAGGKSQIHILEVNETYKVATQTATGIVEALEKQADTTVVVEGLISAPQGERTAPLMQVTRVMPDDPPDPARR